MPPEVRPGLRAAIAHRSVPLPVLLDNLWCLHSDGGRLAASDLLAVQGSAVFLDTCLRQLAFGLAPRPAIQTTGAELLAGATAYQLLLEVASGLRSAVPGESNVLGQFRRACEFAAATLAPDAWQPLRPLVEALLADTRSLRTDHLQGVAGSSYGSLVRALLAPPRDAQVLFVGTGELARSMLPLFRAFNVGVWNHRPAAPLSGVSRWFAPGEADDAAAWASDVIFTTPRDTKHDAAWRARLAGARSRAIQRVVHLGHRRRDGFIWPENILSFNLDDVFALASARDQRRTLQLDRARQACAGLVSARLVGPHPGSIACQAH